MDVDDDDDDDGEKGSAHLAPLRLPPVSTAADLAWQLLLGRLAEALQAALGARPSPGDDAATVLPQVRGRALPARPSPTALPHTHPPHPPHRAAAGARHPRRHRHQQ